MNTKGAVRIATSQPACLACWLQGNKQDIQGLTIYVDKCVEIIPADPASLSPWANQYGLKTLREESGIPDLVFYDEDIAACRTCVQQ
jgi:hypothetical protein